MPDCNGIDILSVTTTVGSAGDAERLARELLVQGLAACVQVDAAVRSYYRWQGRLCEDAEHRLVIKTLPEQEAALREFFCGHHPYEVPQFLCVTMRASEAYGSWARDLVRPLG